MFQLLKLPKTVLELEVMIVWSKPKKWYSHQLVTKVLEAMKKRKLSKTLWVLHNPRRNLKRPHLLKSQNLNKKRSNYHIKNQMVKRTNPRRAMLTNKSSPRSQTNLRILPRNLNQLKPLKTNKKPKKNNPSQNNMNLKRKILKLNNHQNR